ncbi:hypothetical protein P691DRAFT_290991 [Macrolepiota fuliginosa MF-IS2]|uniref:Uncharacterized protein n=1 Tax=Macrolepiota fuliginosa MF-IS2 TaxID=1400762 RepID=A0A9P5X8M7_9AGAR|nr:hypothetical protein P691DRAFT_290991 [Macrolepiota fuliginosa MF-IS2]
MSKPADAWLCGCESMGYEASGASLPWLPAPGRDDEEEISSQGPSSSELNFLAGITSVDLPGPQTCTSHNQGEVFTRGLPSVSYDGSNSVLSAPVYLNGFQASRYTGATTGEGADSASPYYSPRTLDVYPQGFPVETPGLSPSGFGPNTPASTLIITPGSATSRSPLLRSPTLYLSWIKVTRLIPTRTGSHLFPRASILSRRTRISFPHSQGQTPAHRFCSRSRPTARPRSRA